MNFQVGCTDIAIESLVQCQTQIMPAGVYIALSF